MIVCSSYILLIFALSFIVSLGSSTLWFSWISVRFLLENVFDILFHFIAEIGNISSWIIHITDIDEIIIGYPITKMAYCEVRCWLCYHNIIRFSSWNWSDIVRFCFWSAMITSLPNWQIIWLNRKKKNVWLYIVFMKICNYVRKNLNLNYWFCHYWLKIASNIEKTLNF